MMKHKQYGNDPSPDEIRNACERIRAQWSRHEELHRRNAHFYPDVEVVEEKQGDELPVLESV